MSELINNSNERVKKLKTLLLKMHEGVTPEETKQQLSELFGQVPYGEVVQAEQELINEGLPATEIQKYCDLHSQALADNIDLTYAKEAPEGHPVHTFKMENRSLEAQLNELKNIFIKVKFNKSSVDAKKELLNIRAILNNLMDVEKHYIKKENLIFSYLEKYEITGPSMVMWGKDDEVRGLLKSSINTASESDEADAEVLQGYIDLMFAPTANAIREMIEKEEKILLPMCMDKFSDLEWYEIKKQSDEIGYCLYVPETEWKPEGIIETEEEKFKGDTIKLSTGSFTHDEIEALLNTIPVDITFVDKDDKVKFFSHGGQRIFERSKAILGREVQYCHPPSSVHIVDKILDDFKSGRQDSAKFWINLKGMFVHISYYAVRDNEGKYLGTVEVTQDINEYKNTEGERRLLTYDN